MKIAKYVSKNQNLRLVLKPGISAEPVSGRASIPGVYVKFEQGMLDINEVTADRMGLEFEKLIEMVERHPSFNAGFDKLKDDEVDPYKNLRKSAEPEHDIVEITHGSIGKSLNPKPKLNLTNDQRKEVSKIAEEMAKKMAPKMAMEILKNLAKEEKDKKAEDNNNTVKEKGNSRGATNPENSAPKDENENKTNTKKDNK